MKSTVLVGVLAACAALVSCSRAAGPGAPQGPEGLRVFLWDARRLAEAKRGAAAGDETFARVLESARQEADKALARGPWSVMEKKVTPPSGDKHDYMSLAPYWWPDPSKPDGLPYIRRDGEVHAGRGTLDDGPMRRMAGAVRDLALAYYLTGRAAYAERAALVLRTWFLDPATRMNPNLNFGQAVPGRTDGRGIGIIDTVCLTEVVDAAGLLAGAAAWAPADQKALEAWFAAYLRWLVESPLGRDEAATANNHRTWYNVQVASFALFVGRRDLAQKAAQEGRWCIDRQVEADGRQPLELARTKSWDYSTMNLRGLLDLAALAERAGVDLGSHRSPKGAGLRTALEYLLPFATGRQPWPHQQITGFHPERLRPVVRQAAARWGDAAFRDAERLLAAKGGFDWRLELTCRSAAE